MKYVRLAWELACIFGLLCGFVLGLPFIVAWLALENWKAGREQRPVRQEPRGFYDHD